MPSRSEVRLLSDGMGEVVRQAQAELTTFWGTLDHSNPLRVREQLEVFYPALTDSYGDTAATIAADWFESSVGRPAVLAPLIDGDQINQRLRWAMGHSFAGDSAGSLATLGFITDELVKRPGRDTIQESSGRAKVRFARVPSGSDTCAYCLMMASRGYVYYSREAAAAMGRYHPDCNCSVVPDDGVQPEGYDPDELQKQYLAAQGGTTKETLASMRENLGLR